MRIVVNLTPRLQVGMQPLRRLLVASRVADAGIVLQPDYKQYNSSEAEPNQEIAALASVKPLLPIHAPLNIARITVVETCILAVAFAMAFVLARQVSRFGKLPAFSGWIIAGNLRSVALVIAAALIGRALLLPFIGVPEPRIPDEYSYLLMADTFAHHRLANPTPPASEHFETFEVSLTPTYHSKYPVSQGLALTFGEILFHQPWMGVYPTTALACGAICWALQAFVPPAWALLGGLLAVIRLALLSYWMNSYWGGSVAALAGAVALGCVVRLFEGSRTKPGRLQLASGFAISLVLLATSRPYEGLAYSIPLLAYFGYRMAYAV